MRSYIISDAASTKHCSTHKLPAWFTKYFSGQVQWQRVSDKAMPSWYASFAYQLDELVMVLRQWMVVWEGTKLEIINFGCDCAVEHMSQSNFWSPLPCSPSRHHKCAATAAPNAVIAYKVCLEKCEPQNNKHYILNVINQVGPYKANRPWSQGKHRCN